MTGENDDINTAGLDQTDEEMVKAEHDAQALIDRAKADAARRKAAKTATPATSADAPLAHLAAAESTIPDPVVPTVSTSAPESTTAPAVTATDPAPPLHVAFAPSEPTVAPVVAPGAPVDTAILPAPVAPATGKSALTPDTVVLPPVAGADDTTAKAHEAVHGARWFATGKTVKKGSRFDFGSGAVVDFIEREWVRLKADLTADEEALAAKGGEALQELVGKHGAETVMSASKPTASGETTPATPTPPTVTVAPVTDGPQPQSAAAGVENPNAAVA